MIAKPYFNVGVYTGERQSYLSRRVIDPNQKRKEVQSGREVASAVFCVCMCVCGLVYTHV